MQKIELKGLEEIDQLCKKLKSSPEVFARARRECFEEASRELKRLVDYSISTSLEGDVHKIQSWQERIVGSEGGYAKVKPKADTWTERTKKTGNRYAVGAVTTAIVAGHDFPSPSGRKYYKPRIRSGAMRVISAPTR